VQEVLRAFVEGSTPASDLPKALLNNLLACELVTTKVSTSRICNDPSSEEKDTAFMKKFCGKLKEVGPAVYLSFMSPFNGLVNHIFALRKGELYHAKSEGVPRLVPGDNPQLMANALCNLIWPTPETYVDELSSREAKRQCSLMSESV
jgi:hypothetical protein